MALSVRLARPADIDAILQVQAHGDGATGERFRAWVTGAIPTAHERVCVAVRDGTVVGWAATRRFDDPTADAPAGEYLMGVRVRTGSRRTGVGSCLIAARLELIRRSGAHSAYYVTNVRNTASIAAHRRWGFRELGRAARFRDVPFDGGEGILFAAGLL
ncbi:GNAT family N-acetyltransferase [Microbacterium luticocti]|uniref:GNAT family N-acetyltransferase n=1 Tax=Microbacterium luticocti TaxID=451764 RepID=UPI0004159A13|nr:GNAT family N-acetyltransferase [Microbacterium luticocti]